MIYFPMSYIIVTRLYSVIILSFFEYTTDIETKVNQQYPLGAIRIFVVYRNVQIHCHIDFS